MIFNHERQEGKFEIIQLVKNENKILFLKIYIPYQIYLLFLFRYLWQDVQNFDSLSLLNKLWKHLVVSSENQSLSPNIIFEFYES